MKISVNVKGASRKKASIVQLIYEYPEGPLSVSGFLTETVRICLRQYNEKRDAGEILRLFSMEEMEDMALSGRVSVGDPLDRKKADEKKAVSDALLAFEDGLIALFADGKRYEDKEEIMPLHDGSEVTFVRLTFLAGRMW